MRLRAIANEMFRGRVGRDHWKSAREARLSTSANSRERRFHEILDEEYERARLLATPSPPVRTTDAKHPLGKKERLLWAGRGAASALLYRSRHGCS
ncbi:DUF6082 family protein [Actinoallomurus purpureus]|nr:DUF6082 family protein [Actinoallomurus purpureus]